jgi:hypothetical protein
LLTLMHYCASAISGSNFWKRSSSASTPRPAAAAAADGDANANVARRRFPNNINRNSAYDDDFPEDDDDRHRKPPKSTANDLNISDQRSRFDEQTTSDDAYDDDSDARDTEDSSIDSDRSPPGGYFPEQSPSPSTAAINRRRLLLQLPRTALTDDVRSDVDRDDIDEDTLRELTKRISVVSALGGGRETVSDVLHQVRQHIR